MNEQPMQNNNTCCEKEDFLTKDTVTCIAKKTQLYSFFGKMTKNQMSVSEFIITTTNIPHTTRVWNIWLVCVTLLMVRIFKIFGQYLLPLIDLCYSANSEYILNIWAICVAIG